MTTTIDGFYKSQIKTAYEKYCMDKSNSDSLPVLEAEIGRITKEIFKNSKVKGSLATVQGLVSKEIRDLQTKAEAEVKAKLAKLVEAEPKGRTEIENEFEVNLKFLKSEAGNIARVGLVNEEAVAKKQIDDEESLAFQQIVVKLQNSMAIMRTPFHSYKGNITEDNLMKSFKGRYRLGGFKSLMSFSTRDEAVIAGRNLGETRLAKAEAKAKAEAEAKAKAEANTATEAGALTQESKPESQLTTMQKAKLLAMSAMLGIGAIGLSMLFPPQKRPPVSGSKLVQI